MKTRNHTYSRQFARKQWRQNFGDNAAFRTLRWPGREGSFRKFTGRTEKP